MTDSQTHDFYCDVHNCGFKSIGWPTEEQMNLRASEHYAEHATGELAPELAESKARALGGI